MKKIYETPKIEKSTCNLSEILAADNIISDPWGLDDIDE